MTHTYGKRLNANYILVPKWYLEKYPASKRIAMIYKTNLSIHYTHSVSSPLT